MILLINILLDLILIMVNERRRGEATIYFAILALHNRHTVMDPNTFIIKALRGKVIVLGIID